MLTMEKENDGNKALSKKEKGRLKKLKGRATSAQGITNFEDALELRSLLAKMKYNSTLDASENSDYGPSILHVQHDSCKFQDPLNWKQTEGSDHRHLIQSILFGKNETDQKDQSKKNKKRSREDSNISIPSWARPHNTALAENITVIEFSISSGFEDGFCASHLMPSYRMRRDKVFSDDEQNTSEAPIHQKDEKEYILTKLVAEKRALPMRCRLFQGDRPRHATDILMYTEPTDVHKRRRTTLNTVQKNSFETTHDLYNDTLARLKPLVLSAREMENENYPLMQSLKSDNNYVSTHISETQELPNKSTGVYSIDCEMVQTSEDRELARITLLKFCPTIAEPEKYEVVLDELVKPRNPIKDYLTQYSGIVPSMMEGVITSLEDIQTRLLSLICEGDILVGQSLENDLKVCRIVHMNVIDTAVLFRKKGGRKHSLKHLSAVLLKMHIQNNGTNGHCSEEDAAAALLLAIRRARLGDGFQIHERAKRKSIFSQISNSRKQNDDDQPCYLRYNRGPIVCIGPYDWIKQNVASHVLVNALECENIASSAVKAIASYIRPTGRRASLLWSRLSVHGDLMNEKTANDKIDAVIVSG